MNAYWATIVLAIVIAPAAAFAQTGPLATPSSSPSPSPSPAPSATPASAFSPILGYTGEAAANPSGGLRQGTAYAQQILAGFDLDLERLAGVTGGTLHVDVTHRYGNNLAVDDIGNNTSVQEIYGGQGWHLAIFSYEQLLFHDRLDIEVGRIPANVSFVHSAIYCVFQSNSVCANPTFVFENSNFTGYPVSGWGVHAKAFFTDRVYVHVGAYASNTDPDNPGFNFNMSHTTGAIVPAELGYTTSFANDTHPRDYIVGGWYDASTYPNPLHDADGAIALVSGRPGATMRGRSALYARFDQLVRRPDMRSQRGLTLFGVAMTDLSGDVIESGYEELGLVQTGTFGGRDLDTLGFAVNDQHFTDTALDAIRAARLSVGGTAAIATHETMMELNYGIHVSSSVTIAPNVQYIVHPDQFAEPFFTGTIRNALVVGLHVAVDFSPLLKAHH